MRYLVIFLIMIGSNSYASGLQQRSVLNGLLNINIPADFKHMSEDMLEIKYPMTRRPTEVYTNEAGSVNFAFNYTKNALKPSDVSKMHKAMSSMFHNFHDNATWYRDEVITQFGTEMFVMELITSAMDTKIHNIIYGIPVNERLLLVSFNTTIEESEEWLNVGHEAMKSIVIN